MIETVLGYFHYIDSPGKFVMLVAIIMVIVFVACWLIPAIKYIERYPYRVIEMRTTVPGETFRDNETWTSVYYPEKKVLGFWIHWRLARALFKCVGLAAPGPFDDSNDAKNFIKGALPDRQWIKVTRHESDTFS